MGPVEARFMERLKTPTWMQIARWLTSSRSTNFSQVRTKLEILQQMRQQMMPVEQSSSLRRILMMVMRQSSRSRKRKISSSLSNMLGQKNVTTTSHRTR